MEQRLITNGTLTAFKDLIAGNTVYVDKTKFACELAVDRSSILLTRPRRMGKSTMCLTLEYLFSKGTVGTEGLYCHEHWPVKERYFVLRFDWSDITPKSREDFVFRVLEELKAYANYFGLSLPQDCSLSSILKYLITNIIAKLDDDSFLAQHPELVDGDRPFSRDNLVLLIDEYDAPLSKILDKPALFDEIRSEFMDFFSSVKSLPYFRFVFITGVSSYAQTSIFSGANQFINISLDDNYATCCGYTQKEIEHYFAPELVKAQTALNLSYDELMANLGYFYDGYLFCRSQGASVSSNKIFNPVSVSLFLRTPTNGFLNYWGETGAKSTFLFKLLKLCSEALISDLLKKLFADVPETYKSLDPSVIDYIKAWVPALTLSVDVDDNNQQNNRLLEVPTDKLIVKIDNINALNIRNAIPILFQAGYLAIKAIDSNKAKLGLANHEVAATLKSLLMDDSIFTDSDPFSLSKKFSSLDMSASEIFAIFHAGGETLAKFLDDLLNTAPEQLFAPQNHENVITFIIFLALDRTPMAVGREVHYVQGRADLVLYKSNEESLLSDSVIEFKVARQGENVLKKLAAGAKQIVDKRYGISYKNPDPVRYCIVFSNDLRQVGAIGAVTGDGSYEVTYLSSKLTKRGTLRAMYRKATSKAKQAKHVSSSDKD
ncbi:AAA family ATPase [Anaerobiospirillum succiniciproducens]|uniref:AAA family ATPase n=1 Tax=Anaerobiospirillum succiniciproducens TaxID=13335 RepID=UPI002353B1B2|nr:AAA family ATPase [Anaerobiospirillum succiniciproducens]MCI6862938.1 ATP-binding protein [Anaerobiospirillum succiniciproducens]